MVDAVAFAGVVGMEGARVATDPLADCVSAHGAVAHMTDTQSENVSAPAAQQVIDRTADKMAAEGARNGIALNGSKPPRHNQSQSPKQVVRAADLLEPVRSGLERVETRLRSADNAGQHPAHNATHNATHNGASLFAPLSNAFLTLIGSGGKRLRPALALLAAEMNPARGTLQGTPDYGRVIALAASVEMLHTSTLVHDDVIDGALLRRGAPTLNATWSGGSTVLAGNYMFGSAAQLSAETGSVRVIRAFADTLRVIVDGELRQLLDRFRFDQPRESYYQRIYAKTASLFCAATEGAALLSEQPEEGINALRSYGYHLGMAFQIVDDILDFTSDESTLGKPAGSDLLQGTLTLPFFHYLRNRPNEAAFVAEIERAQTRAEMGDAAEWQAMVHSIVQELRTDTAGGSAIDAARAEAYAFADHARADLAIFPDTIYRRSMLGLCDFVVQRTF
jgi:geranylgeranyl pyrophosphate synthase